MAKDHGGTGAGHIARVIILEEIGRVSSMADEKFLVKLPEY